MSWSSSYVVRLFALCFLAVALGAADSVLASAYLPDIVRELLPSATTTDAGLAGAWVNFAFLAGGTVGGILLGFLSDRIGRRAILALALLCYGLGSAAGALAPGWEMLALSRLLVGAGVGAALVVTAVLITEAWKKEGRAVALGMLSIAYPVGVVASGAVTAHIADWRMAFWWGSVPALLAPAAWYWVRESTAWAAARKDRRPALLEEHRSALLTGILVYGTMLVGIWAAFSWLPTWVQSLLGETGPDGQEQRGFAVALLGMGGMGGGVASGFLAKRFGSRPVQGVCFVLCLLLTVFLFKMTKTYTPATQAGILLLGITFGISQGVLNSYVPELFPAALRSAATALCFHVGRAFTAAAVWFVGAFVVWFGGYGEAIFAFSLAYLAGLIALFSGKKRSSEKPGEKALDELEF